MIVCLLDLLLGVGDDICWSTMISILVKRGGPGSSTVDLRARKAQQRRSTRAAAAAGAGHKGTGNRGSKSRRFTRQHHAVTRVVRGSAAHDETHQATDLSITGVFDARKRYHTSRIASPIPLTKATYRKLAHRLVHVPDKMVAVSRGQNILHYPLIESVDVVSTNLACHCIQE